MKDKRKQKSFDPDPCNCNLYIHSLFFLIPLYFMSVKQIVTKSSSLARHDIITESDVLVFVMQRQGKRSLSLTTDGSCRTVENV